MRLLILLFFAVIHFSSSYGKVVDPQFEEEIQVVPELEAAMQECPAAERNETPTPTPAPQPSHAPVPPKNVKPPQPAWCKQLSDCLLANRLQRKACYEKSENKGLELNRLCGARRGDLTMPGQIVTPSLKRRCDAKWKIGAQQCLAQHLPGGRSTK